MKLPTAAPTTLEVYDLQGRRVAVPVTREVQEIGVHRIPLGTSGWRPGVYYCRLSSADQVLTRKFVLLR